MFPQNEAFIGLFNGISFIFILLMVWAVPTKTYVNQKIRGCISFIRRLYLLVYLPVVRDLFPNLFSVTKFEGPSLSINFPGFVADESISTFHIRKGYL